SVLNGSQVPDPALRMGEDAVRFVLAPFASAVGALKGANEKLSPEKMVQCEADLIESMPRMAEQQRFRDCFLKVAGEKTRTQLTPAESFQYQASADPPGAILETRIEELRLERTVPQGDSFALRIKSRMRLLDAPGGTVLYDQPFEYRSGASLFLDWTLH